jgi:hypothetical protein
VREGLVGVATANQHKEIRGMSLALDSDGTVAFIFDGTVQWKDLCGNGDLCLLEALLAATGDTDNISPIKFLEICELGENGVSGVEAERFMNVFPMYMLKGCKNDRLEEMLAGNREGTLVINLPRANGGSHWYSRICLIRPAFFSHDTPPNQGGDLHCTTRAV